MAADGNLLQGIVIEDPASEGRDVERLLSSLFQALVAEQREGVTYKLDGAPAREAQAGSA